MSNLEVKPIKTKDESAWDDLWLLSRNGTIFHTRKFLSYHMMKMSFSHLAVKEKGRLIAVITGGIINNRYLSPWGASYGGVIHNEDSLARVIEIYQVLVDYCRKENQKGIDLTLAPLVYDWDSSQLDCYAAESVGFENILSPASSVIKVPSEAEKKNWLFTCESSARRAIRKALKLGVKIRFNSPSENFYKILAKNKSRNKSKPVHSESEIRWLCTNFPNEIFFLNAYLGKQEIAGLWLFKCNPRVMLTFYIYNDYNFQEYRATDLLLYKATLLASEMKIPYLDLGVSEETIKGELQPSLSLIRFKMKYTNRLLLRPKLTINF